MMRRRFASIPLLLVCCLLLTGCASSPLSPIVTEEELPSPEAENARLTETTSTLWFRFLDEGYLAAESRVVTASPTVSYEKALLDALVSGPEASSAELRGLFPPGTRVLSTHQEGRRLFVTLSHEIMGNFADEPDNWQSNPVWAREVMVRRVLAMEAIVATVTENCDLDSVVILVEQHGATLDSLRLRQGYYRTGEGDDLAIAAELIREDVWLLTPDRTAEIILQCWNARDFARLYKYVARMESDRSAPRMDEAAFLQEMADMPHLLESTSSCASVNEAGDQAVFALNLIFLQDGREIPMGDSTLRLTRQDGIWRIPLSQLIRWKEASP